MGARNRHWRKQREKQEARKVVPGFLVESDLLATNC